MPPSWWSRCCLVAASVLIAISPRAVGARRSPRSSSRSPARRSRAGRFATAAASITAPLRAATALRLPALRPAAAGPDATPRLASLHFQRSTHVSMDRGARSRVYSFFPPTPALAAGTGIVHGVITQSGTPTAGATVTLTGEGTRSTLRRPMRAANTRFPPCLSAAIILTAHVDGATDRSADVDVHSDTVATVKSRLAQDDCRYRGHRKCGRRRHTRRRYHDRSDNRFAASPVAIVSIA